MDLEKGEYTNKRWYSYYIKRVLVSSNVTKVRVSIDRALARDDELLESAFERLSSDEELSCEEFLCDELSCDELFCDDDGAG